MSIKYYNRDMKRVKSVYKFKNNKEEENNLRNSWKTTSNLRSSLKESCKKNKSLSSLRCNICLHKKVQSSSSIINDDPDLIIISKNIKEEKVNETKNVFNEYIAQKKKLFSLQD